MEPSLLQRVLLRDDTLKILRDFVGSQTDQLLLDTWIECELFRRNCVARESGGLVAPSPAAAAAATGAGGHTVRHVKDEWDHVRRILRAVEALPMIDRVEALALQQAIQNEQISRRLSIALHAESVCEYPRADLIVSVHKKLLSAIERRIFRDLMTRNGYRLVLERIMGRIV